MIGILDLQSRNLTKSISEEEKRSQGFVTVEHSYELLKKLNDLERHIIAKDDDQVIAYVLSMTKAARWDVPILVPMFQLFDELIWKGKTISEIDYITVGQVCVDKEFRGSGVFDQCYSKYREFHREKYDFAITEIAESNTRSIKAHERVGFEELISYVDPFGTNWKVVIWEF